MCALGMDAGTYTLVTCQRDDQGNFLHKKEINAFIEFPIESRFVFNMMKNAGVPLIERKEAGVAYALGEAALDIAYTMNQIDIRRPMKDGCLNPKERSAQQILSIMIHSLLDNVKKDNETLYYSIPANAINEETDADYHSKVLEAIFKAFKNEKGFTVNPQPINEGLALVYAELAEKNWTGLGISFGGGMINVCFAMFGAPIFQFSIVNSGDWIDKQAARATGESVAFINREKMKLDLSESSDSVIQRAIRAQYEIMMQKTVTEIKKGLEKSGNKARTNTPIDIVIAGGTSCPKGFAQLFGDVVKKSHLPMEVGKIIRPKDPLYSVARGALIAAEAADQS
jgi:actin-like ATPase involved in cell morphogenesis